MRRRIVCSSWKMHINSLEAGTALARDIAGEITKMTCNIDIFILPAFPIIPAVSDIFHNTPIKWGAQNVAFLEQGALTGEVPPDLLTGLSCTYVEIGHAERRQYFSETDTIVNQKVKLCLQYGLVPIICLGETAEDIGNNTAKVRLQSQVLWALNEIPQEKMTQVIFAYEPVWAIGKEKAAQVDYVENMHGHIRNVISQNFGSTIAEETRIIYGGSVSPDSAVDLSKQENVDGVFVGRYGLKADNFARIVRAFNEL